MSRIFSAATSTVNAAGSARRDVRMSTSIDVHAPIAASSSSTGVNSPSDPVPTEIVVPCSFVTVYLPAASRAMLTCRCPSCAISATTLSSIRRTNSQHKDRERCGHDQVSHPLTPHQESDITLL